MFNNNWSFNKKAKEKYKHKHKNDVLSAPIGSIYILSRIEINEKYRGHNLSKKVFDCIVESLNINSNYILLKAFPLQHESCDENFDEKQFLIDRDKLIKLYSDWGFAEIYNDDINTIMIKDTQYK